MFVKRYAETAQKIDIIFSGILKSSPKTIIKSVIITQHSTKTNVLRLREKTEH